MTVCGVTFDFGQTLASLDAAMLARRLSERGVTIDPARVDAATPAMWRAYNDLIRSGAGGHPWKPMMRVLLAESGVAEEAAGPLVEWLWDEQPAKNLWRRPIAGMIELAMDLAARGVRVGVVSNSEGGLAALIDELGWSGIFPVVADSGALGIEKPDPAIFAWACERMGVALADSAHVGDAWAADFEGALAAGMRAVLFRGAAFVPAGADLSRGGRAAVCEDAAEVDRALRAWGY